MVFTTLVKFRLQNRKPCEFWRKRKIFKISQHFVGRKRNCYSLAIRAVHRALNFATKGRKLKKQDMRELWDTRINAGCEQHGVLHETFKDAMYRNNIQLNRKVLADLAAWEPYSFKSLTEIAQQCAIKEGFFKKPDLTPPVGTNLRGLWEMIYGKKGEKKIE